MSNPNPPAPPPRVNRPDHPHYEVPGCSLVDFYGLGSIVRELRLSGKSYRDIMEHINSNGYIPRGFKISHNAISRWCRDNGLGGDMSEKTPDEAINVYRENVKSLQDINASIDTITVLLDDMNQKLSTKRGKVNVSDFTKISMLLDRMTTRRQVLTQEIRDMQREVYQYSTVSTAMTMIREIVSKYLTREQYEAMLTELRENSVLCEALKQIAPTGV